MEVDRYKINGQVRCRIWSEYEKETLAFEPKELMSLLRWLQEHENEITNDAIENRVNDEMKGM
jgi:hypothetical protein